MSTTAENTNLPSSTAEPSLISGQPVSAEPAAPAVVDPAAPAAEPVKPALVSEPTPVVPLSFETLKIPDGLQIDDAAKTTFLDIMNNDKFTPAERAQALIDLQASAAQGLATAQEKIWADTQEQWANEVKADKDIGGDKLAPALGAISKVLDEFGSPELREVFTLTGAGNNVHMVKFLHKIAGQLTEGGAVSGSPAPTATSLANKLFPTMN